MLCVSPHRCLGVKASGKASWKAGGKLRMQFSEANGAWQVIPRWADFLIRLGFEWPEGESETRRIGLISMPCDSAAAGLIALGAMRRRLELDDANDLTAHFQRIRALALRGRDVLWSTK
jgi:hypothetical protein